MLMFGLDKYQSKAAMHASHKLHLGRAHGRTCIVDLYCIAHFPLVWKSWETCERCIFWYDDTPLLLHFLITCRSQWHQGQHCCSSLYNLKWSQIWYWWCYPHQWASTTWSSQRYLNRRSCVEAQSPLSNLCVTEHCDALVRPYGTNREKLRANAKENILQCMYCTRVTFLWLWQTLVVRASFVAVLLVVLLDVLFVVGCVVGNTAQQQ